MMRVTVAVWKQCVKVRVVNSERELTRPRSLDVAKLISLFLPFSPSVSSSMIFQILTNLSIPPVAIHPLIWGLISKAAVAPSCAANVYFG